VSRLSVSSSSVTSVIEQAAAMSTEAVAKLEAGARMSVQSSTQPFEAEGGVKILSEMLEAKMPVQIKIPAVTLDEFPEADPLLFPAPEVVQLHVEAPEIDYFNTTGVEEALDGLLPGRNHSAPAEPHGESEVTLWSLINSMEGFLLMLILLIAG